MKTQKRRVIVQYSPDAVAIRKTSEGFSVIVPGKIPNGFFVKLTIGFGFKATAEKLVTELKEGKEDNA